MDERMLKNMLIIVITCNFKLVKLNTILNNKQWYNNENLKNKINYLKQKEIDIRMKLSLKT